MTDPTQPESPAPLTGEPSPEELEAAAIAATLFAHRRAQLASQVVTRNERDTSNWKWVSRWERMNR